MADNREGAQQEDLPDLSRVADDVWLDALFWIGRAEVGMKFALIDDRFGRLVRTHFNLRKWTMGDLAIQRTRADGTATATTSTAAITIMDNNALTQWLPIATSPAPKGIVGFRSIYIWYVDMEVIAFLQLMRRTFDRGITLQFDIHAKESCCWALMSQRIWPLISQSITTLYDMKAVNFSLLRRHMSPNVLLDCASLCAIKSTHMFPVRPSHAVNESAFLEPPANAWAETPQQQLFRWLHTPRKDGRAKLLTFHKWRLKLLDLLPDLETFFYAPDAIAVKYIVTCEGPTRNFRKTELVNERTQEQLTAGPDISPFFNFVPQKSTWMVARCPIATNKRTLRKWEREAAQQRNLLYINIDDSDIGPSLLAELAELLPTE